ncbi:hypothetical protein P8605_30740 [Streptomyces sp. T-3]|nr:hypothetical protein [Streptomyces sp. T-3]
MSQYAPQHQPTDGNPFAQPAPASGSGRDNIALGIVVGVVAMIVGALAYGGIMRAMGKEDGSYTEIGYVAVGVGALVGFAMGKVGGRNPLLPIISVPLALAGVYLGQLFGFALLMSFWSKGTLSVGTVLTEHSDLLFEGWKQEADAMTWLFIAIAGFVAFSSAKKAGS